MNIDHPLRFHPLFRRYLWGGRRLESLLHKPLPPGHDYAESWEVVDRGSDQSIVVAGPWKGTSLADLLRHDRPSVLGTWPPPGPFPLLFKFLDAHQNLSVQVHPNDQQASQLTPPDRGKTEAWVVLHADPHSYIYAGLRPGVDRQALADAIQRGATESCLHRLQPARGDCVFIPAGTVHALGAGLVVAEIQQSSDVTYRLFDWDRVAADGRARPLHIEAGLNVIDFLAGPIMPSPPQANDGNGIEPLVNCDKFVLERRRFTDCQSIGGDDRCHLIIALSGAIQVERDPVSQPLSAGQTVLLPAGAGALDCAAEGAAELLDIYLPAESATDVGAGVVDE